MADFLGFEIGDLTNIINGLKFCDRGGDIAESVKIREA